MVKDLIARGYQMGGFLAAGLPAFALAIPLNWFLVDRLHWWAPSAYALALVGQVSLNFFMCRRFVFRQPKSTRLHVQFGQFMVGILFFRMADWLLYTLLVKYVGLYYLGVQVANVLVFAVLKFKFSQRVMEEPI
jgi:putative flippase GtrA